MLKRLNSAGPPSGSLLLHVFAVLLVLFLLVPAVSAAEQHASASRYTLAAGDEVKITVYGEEELSIETRLSDTGTIIYPFLGELKLSGKTIGQVEQIITTGLKKGYLVDPKVSVNVQEYRQFYVNGQVKSPGGYPYQPGLTVQRAVSLAGGFTELADRDKLFVVHEDDPAGTLNKVSLNSRVKPGDIVIVEESFF